jgi:serine/threonine protein kinase
MAKPNDRIGPYTLVSKLGRGAFGVVWLAEKRGLITTRFALKLPNEEEVDLAAVEKEASVWLHAGGHPNVLPIIEADVYDEQVVIVSEYAPDGSLAKWLERHSGKAPSVELAVEMIYGIIAGLEHLHKRGIIHRDLKPDNILLQNDTPRLADFGIARILKTTSKSTFATGTPAYMPPEAFDGKRSEQTDIWAVGVIFYQLLTGHLPFPQTDMPSLLAAIITKEPDPLPDWIPEHIRKIIDLALKKNQTERFGSVGDMRQALREATQHQRPINNREAKTEVLPRNEAELLPTIVEPKLTEAGRWQLEYWTAFRAYLERKNSFLSPPKPPPQYWIQFPIGRSNFALHATVEKKHRKNCVYLVLTGRDAKPHFYLLERDREAIHRELGEEAEWRERPSGKESHVLVCQHETDPENRQNWEAQHEWLKEKLELFHKVFAPRVKTLKASEYIKGDEEKESLGSLASTSVPETIAAPIDSPPLASSDSTLSVLPTELALEALGVKTEERKTNWIPIILVVIFAPLIGALSIYYVSSFRAKQDNTSNATATITSARAELVFSRADFNAFTSRASDDLGSIDNLNVRYTKQLKSVEGVEAVTPVLRYFHSTENNIEIIDGVDWPSYSAVNQTQLISGRAFMEADSGLSVAMISKGKADKDNLKPGDSMKLWDNTIYTIIGVFLDDYYSDVKIALIRMQSLLEAYDKCSFILIKCKNANEQKEVAGRINAALPGNKVLLTSDVFGAIIKHQGISSNTPTSLNVHVTAREELWLSVFVDDAPKARGFVLKPNQTETFTPTERLRIQYAQVKAPVLEVIINGQKARVPTDKTELVITKDNYQQLLQ